ncbi:MAG TPA: exodeoxyribonuclease VII large subunit [Rhodopila sp.]|nr:exodeoxyribonuclease VII large subunit [Rhodopila sp.]
MADLMERRLQEIASQVTAGGRLIGVTGQLAEIPEPRRNGVIYDVRLVDPVSTEFVLLEMRPSTLLEADAQEGDTITAYGPVVANLYKGRATLRLQVDRIELAEPPEERERRAAQLPLLETVRQVGATRNAFPASPAPSITLLRSGSSAVRDDFLGTLGELRATLPIREVEVSMASPADVATQIESCTEDVLVLIRGGGDASDFAVFEAPAVLKALGRCRSFRLLGLGHSQHRTLADCIADHAAAVPAEAGRFLRERVLEIHQKMLEAQAVSELRKAAAAQWSWRATIALMAVVFLAGILFSLILMRWAH